MLKLDELKPGDIIISTTEGLCFERYEECIVQTDAIDKTDVRSFYVECNAGMHYLDGNIDKDGTLIGFKRKGEK